MAANERAVKPERLHEGDTVAVVSPSAGVAYAYPHIYENGLRNLEMGFGLKIKEFKTARKSNDWLYTHPKERAEDINRAFEDPDVNAIIASIGGDDSVRILKYLDSDVIKANPKIIMGFSDSTTFLTFINRLGLVTFNGPSVMAGFAQMENFPKSFEAMVRSILFEPEKSYEYRSFPFYSNGYPDWAKESNVGKVKKELDNDGFHWLQGNSSAKGVLFGGNADVMEFLKGTEYWPEKGFWKGKLLFLETSEDKPLPDVVKYWIRNYATQGILREIGALLLAIPRDYSEEEKKELENKVMSILQVEEKIKNMPVVSNMDFGHTDPRFILPLGVRAEVDPKTKRFRLLEPAVR